MSSRSYLVLDGYNLIGALDRYRPGAVGGLDAARERLVNDALKAAGWTGRRAVVVFDAQRGPGTRRREELRVGGVARVIYSAPGESADDVIEKLLGVLGNTATVFTADFALQRTALARGATRATPREFANLIDGLPTVKSNPENPRSPRVKDQLSPEMLRKLEEIRRRAE